MISNKLYSKALGCRKIIPTQADISLHQQVLGKENGKQNEKPIYFAAA